MSGRHELEVNGNNPIATVSGIEGRAVVMSCSDPACHERVVIQVFPAEDTGHYVAALQAVHEDRNL